VCVSSTAIGRIEQVVVDNSATSGGETSLAGRHALVAWDSSNIIVLTVSTSQIVN